VDLDDNQRVREAVLARVRTAVGRTGPDGEARATAQAYLAARRQGPRPAMPAELVAHRRQRADERARRAWAAPGGHRCRGVGGR
jgi:L-lactate dehydrogenase complex protein LldG